MTAVRTNTDRKWSRWHQRFVVEERFVEPAERRRLYRTSAVLITVGLIGFIVVLIGVLTSTGFERFDQPVEDFFNSQLSDPVTAFMIVLAVVFGPIAMPIIVLVVVAVWLVTARHAWRPMLLAGGMATGLILVQVLAPLVQHPRPPVGLMLFGPDHSFSFPSGHVLGAADFLLIFTFLLVSRIRRTWFTVAAVTFSVLTILGQVISRLYLGYHWISDTTASVALSLAIVGGIIALDTKRTVRVPGEEVVGAHSRVQEQGT